MLTLTLHDALEDAINDLMGDGAQLTIEADDLRGWIIRHTNLRPPIGDIELALRQMHQAGLIKLYAEGGNNRVTIEPCGPSLRKRRSDNDHDGPKLNEIPRLAMESEAMSAGADKKKVFIIHGRNAAARTAVEHFLKALKLEPLDFDELAADMGTEFVGNIVLEGLKKAHGIVVLFTPDEFAALFPDLRETHETDAMRWQSRPNVLFEAGIAFGLARDRSVLATMGSGVSLFSDVKGIHIVRLDNGEDSRKKFRQKIIGTGCAVDLRADSYTDPARSGDFEAPVARFAGVSPPDPFAPPPTVAHTAPVFHDLGDDEVVALARNWLRARPAEIASFTYDDINKALPVAVSPAVLRRLLPKAAEDTGWEVEAHENIVTLSFDRFMST